MKYYIICSVRDADQELRDKLESYALSLEMEGHEVHLPHRDTNQDATGLEICDQNMAAMIEADEIKVFWDPKSFGSHFDLGIAFVLDKRLDYVEGPQPDEAGPGKSFPRMIHERIELQEDEGQD